MHYKLKTTEFSAHLSRSRMNRYLHNQLTANEIKEVELHLIHCERCSEGILEHILSEESHNHKVYEKMLKGKLKLKETGRKISVSPTQMRAARATVALLLLFVFSFFGISAVINKNTAGAEQPKAQVRVKKTQQPKKQSAVLLAEQKTEEVPTKKEVSVDKKESSPALAMQNSSDAQSSYSESREESKPKARSTQKSAPVTILQHTAPQTSAAVNQVEATTQANSNGQESQQEATINTSQLPKVEPQTQENIAEDKTEERMTIRPLPKIEKLDIKKSEEKDKIDETESSVIPMPKEVKLLQQK